MFFFNPFEVHSGACPDLHEYDVLYPSRRFVSDCRSPIEDKSVFPLLRTDVLHRSEATDAFTDAVASSSSSTAYIEEALCRLLLRCSFQTDAVTARGVDAVRAACLIIDEKYASLIRTETLARWVGFHTSHFVRLFHRVTGIAPQAYVRQVRVARARQLICDGVELAQAAQLVGFCDQPHLTREFKKVYGVAPGRMSRDIRAAHDNHGRSRQRPGRETREVEPQIDPGRLNSPCKSRSRT